nr:hypothetical protein [uncultured Microbacterium sp.]
MTDEQQPEVQWAPIEPKPKNPGRLWLIVGLVVAALVIVAVLLFFLLPRGESAAPGETASPTPSASATASATPAPTDSAAPSEEPDPSMTPITTPPPVPDPSVDAFRGQVQGWLDDARTGLDIASETSGQDALSVIESLQADAQRLGETAAPSSIATEWQDAVGAYYQRLTDLRTAVSGGSDSGPAIDAARSAAEELRGLVGL